MTTSDHDALNNICSELGPIFLLYLRISLVETAECSSIDKSALVDLRKIDEGIIALAVPNSTSNSETLICLYLRLSCSSHANEFAPQRDLGLLLVDDAAGVGALLGEHEQGAPPGPHAGQDPCPGADRL